MNASGVEPSHSSSGDTFPPKSILIAVEARRRKQRNKRNLSQITCFVLYAELL